MNEKKRPRRQPIKIELEEEETVTAKEEARQACTSNYFKDEKFKLSFNEIELDENNNIENNDDDYKSKLEGYSNAKKLKWEPPKWQEQFELIRKMRKENDAPVDTMGCEAISAIDPMLTPEVKRFHVLVSLMLSSQTKDEVTAKAMSQLQQIPLTIENVLETSDEKLEKMIYPVSFYKRKVVYIKKTAQILKDTYNGDIPNNIEDLIKLPGVGPKMGYLTMTCAWNEVVGIGVDTHVHRISNRLKWFKTQTKTPEQTRKELQEWLPQSHWEEVNHLLVGFGQQICRPIGPHCTECLCKEICPTGKENISLLLNKKSKKSKKII